MIGWLKKIGGKPFHNKAGLDEGSVKHLSQDFAQLDAASPELAARALRYVLDDEDATVLLGLATLANGAELLGLICSQRSFIADQINDRRLFFQSVKNPTPDFLVRLGRVYEALSRSTPRRVVGIFGDPALAWLEILLMEATQYQLNVWPKRCRKCPALSAALLEAMLTANGNAPEILIRAAFQPTLQRFGGAEFEPVFLSLDGIGESAVRHKGVLVQAFHHPDFKQRLYTLEMMKKCKVPPGPFLEELIGLALGSSKQVREQAEALLAQAKSAARPWLERKIAEGANDEKVAAVRLLWSIEGEAARAFLHARLATEQTKKVTRAIEDIFAVAAPVGSPATEATLQLPPLASISPHAPLGAETQRAWQECFQKVDAAIAKLNAAQAGARYHNALSAPSPDEIERAFRLVQDGEEKKPILLSLASAAWTKELSGPIKEFWQRPELNLLHLVRFLICVGALRPDREHDQNIFSYGYWLELLLPVFRRTQPHMDLRELGAAFSAAGLDARRIGLGVLRNYHEMPAPFGFAAAQIWPYWAEHLDLIEHAFAPAPGHYMERFYQRHARKNAFYALATFPQTPERLVPLLWNLALGAKSERSQAQRCLSQLPDKFDRLATSLSTGAAETRFAAAEWLGRLGDSRAVGVLLAALKREKNEMTKGAIMSALELLGVPVDQFLDRKGLLKEAEKGMAKGVPEDFEWFPFDQLPKAHWEDTTKPIDRVVLQWWLVQGFKLKNPEPGALLRRYCASIRKSEREALGQFVLEAWLGEDTVPIARSDAEQRALQQAQQYAQWCQTSYWPQNSPKKTVEEFYADFLPGLLLQPKGSAVSSKGVLSLAGACAGSEAAPVISRYLKQWYGMRAAQCRALLQMLAWVEHKTATQLLLAVGSRFRTRSIQEEANKQAQALAERKGWTVAELADRTIPGAGVDEDGILTLDFGPRQFTGRLNENLEFELSDADGKALKSLPEPRKDDDEAKAAEAKKTFSAAKKELKSVVTMQRDRFYEAMCTQRTWPFEDWNLYLNRHPIVSRHCQRLVWSVVRDGKVSQLFRPLADGTLTDAADDPVTLQPEDVIRTAHECQVTPAQSQAWRQHLKDYDVEPLFEQFGRPNFDLPEERKQEDELADFRGHLVEAFKLRGRANKLSYTRGQPQDGGWFFDYHKRFPTLGMEAVIEFTGNGLPEENRTVALTTFRFERVAAEGEPVIGGAKMSLGEVPAVLLSECWNDLRQIAAEGPGFDPEWEKKTGM